MASGNAREVSPLPDPAYHDFNCPSVLLPLVPDDNYRPRVLLAGGARSQLIDLGQADSNWVDVPRLSAVKMQPGATVTGLWRSNDTHLDLFATEPTVRCGQRSGKSTAAGVPGSSSARKVAPALTPVPPCCPPVMCCSLGVRHRITIRPALWNPKSTIPLSTGDKAVI
jgi:hypothetical protein